MRLVALILALVPLAAPFAAEAQQAGTIHRVGILPPGPIATGGHFWDAFRKGLRELGHVEGQSISLQFPSEEVRSERLPHLAAELVRLKVDLIVTAGEPAVRAAKQATNTIPIVMAASPDPVGTGLVASLARPGANVTGLTTLSSELSGKRLELLREVVPRLTRVAVLAYAADQGTASFLRELQLRAPALGLRLLPLSVRAAVELDGAFSAMSKDQASGLVMPNHPFFTEHRRRIVELAAKGRLPAMYAQKEFVDVGGLMSYGPSLPDLFRRAAGYADKILKGAKPGDLPVEQPTKFDLAINLETARALGLKIPPSLRLRADHVVE